MTLQLRRLLPGVRQVVLTVGAVLGLVCILVAIGAVLFGLRPLVFRSGSMGPTIDTGALAIARQTDAAALDKGDIVSVVNRSGDRVTHRILAMERDGQDALLTLKGDANEAADAEAYRVSEADRVLFSVPWVGYVIGWLTGPFGLFFLGLYAAFLISVIVRGPAGPPGGPGDKPSGRPGRRKAAGTRRASSGRAPLRSLRAAVPAVALTFLAGTGAQLSTSPTLAAWADTGTVSGTALQAYSVPAATLSCAKVASDAEFTWTAVAGATSYTLSFSGGAAKAPVTLTTTTYLDTAPSIGRVAQVVVNRLFAGPPSTTWSSVGSNSFVETSTNGRCSASP